MSRNLCVNNDHFFSIDTDVEIDSIAWKFNDIEIIAEGKHIWIPLEDTGKLNVSAEIFFEEQKYQTELNNYINVIDAPFLTSVITGPDSIYRGDVTSIVASGADEYSWEPLSDIDINTGGYISASPLETTDFIVTGSNRGCSAKDTVRVVILPGPENDDICNAAPLNEGMNGPFTNKNASVEMNEPLPDTSDCNTQYSWCNQEGGLQASVWFKYEPKTSAASFITSGFDTQIAIYKAESCEQILNGDYSLIAANDDYYGKSKDYAAAINLISLEPDAIYWVQVDGSAGGTEGEFFINIQEAPLSINLSEDEQNQSIQISPNPSNGSFTLAISGFYGIANISMYDISGREIINKKLNLIGNYRDEWFLNEKGIYFIHVESKGNSLIKKVLIQ